MGQERSWSRRAYYCHGHPWVTRRTSLLLVACLLLPALVRAQVEPHVSEVTLGVSTQGRSITALRIGGGPRKLVLVGAVHGGPERNTFELATELATHFRANPSDVPPGISLYIIPTLNPDGLALDVRQNGNGVDLNRNMDTSADSCPGNDWNHEVEGAYGIISDTGGPYSDSEIESRLIRDFLLDANGVIFFHTSGGVVFPACDHAPSNELGRVFAAGSGYEFIQTWDLYNITGGMHDWAGGLGIAAITPELVTADQPETTENLAGVRAVMQQAETLLPLPQAHVEGGVEVQPIIWRAWKAWGAERIFGLPLGHAVPSADGWTQIFERAVFEYKPALSHTTGVVQIVPLGRELFEPPAVALATTNEQSHARSETTPELAGLFGEFWQINGGSPIFGLPLTGEEPAINQERQPVVRQVFERAVLERPVDATSLADISIAPLGRIRWAQRDARSPHSSVQVR